MNKNFVFCFIYMVSFLKNSTQLYNLYLLLDRARYYPRVVPSIFVSFHHPALETSISLCSCSSDKQLAYQHKFMVSNPYFQTSLLHHIWLLLNYMPHQRTKINTVPPNSWQGHLNCGLIS